MVGRDFEGMRRGEVADWMGEGNADDVDEEGTEARVDDAGAVSVADGDPT